MTATFTILAGILGFLGVALGAFGAHALASRWKDTPHLEAAFKTGVQYHMYHTLALLGVAGIVTWTPVPTTHDDLFIAAGWLFVLGIILFSGSLYALALTGNRRLGMITPLGGLAFLGGWLFIVIAAMTPMDFVPL
jgi:uncharacterized membrane protein YgdD (TMEM256/DUF423 family)